MPIDDLLSKRLIVLSGKGGVGKSVVGAALSLAAVARGKRALLVEIDAPLEASRHLGAGPVGTLPTEVRPGLFAVNLSPARVMDEYVRSVVKIEILARKILESPIYSRFFTAAPGLRELMTLGKIMVLEEAREGWSRRPRYDVVIVDAPATGHGLAFLKVPIAAEAAAPVGPIGANARRILGLLRDARRSALVVVAIPEEMAVVEATWFHRLAVEEVGIRPALTVLNAAHERRLSPAQEGEVLRLTAAGVAGRLDGGIPLEAALESARRHIRRRKMTSFYRTRLKRALPMPLVTLPYLVDGEIGLEALQGLALRLADY